MSRSRQASTHSVVLPNIDAAITGRSVSSAGGDASAIAHTAAAARVSTIREMRLMPATSTIDGIIVIPRVPR